MGLGAIAILVYSLLCLIGVIDAVFGGRDPEAPVDWCVYPNDCSCYDCRGELDNEG